MILKARAILNILDNVGDLIPGWQTWNQSLIEYKKNKEMVIMSKVLLGLNENGQELKALLKKRELAVKSGNPTTMIDADLAKYSDIFFDPKLNVMKTYLEDKKSLTDEEKKQRDEIYAAMSKWRATSDMGKIPAELKKLIGEKRAVKNKIYKRIEDFNGFASVKEMTYVAKDLKPLLNLNDLMTETIPTSLIRVAMELDKTKVTNEDILKVTFASTEFNKINGDIKTHIWVIVYDLVEMEALKGDDASETLMDNEVI
ncbi:MAG: hypothetical protein ACRCX2_25690 [Paraclostridium sp.]